MMLLALNDVTATEWAVAGSILVVSAVVARLVGGAVRSIIERTGSGRGLSITAGRVVTYVVFVMGVIYAMSTVDLAIGPLIGALGIGGLVVALALQGVVENLFAGILLHARRPFVIGDEIQSGDHEGTVFDITARTVILDSYTGERVFLPNASVLSDPIVTVTAHRLRRLDHQVGVAYDTDLPTARDVLLRAATPHSESRPPQVFATDFGDSAIGFTVMVWHKAPKSERWRVRDALTMDIHQALGDAGIGIPFPQRTVWLNTVTESPADESPATESSSRDA